MATERVFVPFGELKTDLGDLANDGLVRASGVIPHGGSYVPTGKWENRTSADLAAEPYGLHIHASGGGWYGYTGTATKLYEFSNTGAANWTVTDKTRTVGGNYGAPAANSGWQGVSFGDAVIMTNYTDDPQILLSPATANFAKLAQSGGGNPGMDPKAKFAAPIRNNLFLAYLNLSGAFDGLSAGANPTLVAWSQNDNCRQYGSFNATPQLIGAGYQPLNFDLGDIAGIIGGQYGLVALQRGWVRIDGPPYSFRPISQGIGCQFANSIVRFDDDVYFWGPAGPMVFRGGEGPAVPLAKGKLLRTLLDTAVVDAYTSYSLPGSINLGAIADHVNRQVWFVFEQNDDEFSSFLIYDVDTDRFTYWANPVSDSDGGPVLYRFIRTRPDVVSGWSPGRDIVALKKPEALSQWRPATVQYNGGANITMELGYNSYNDKLSTRIVGVRPALTQRSESTSTSFEVQVHSKNKSWIAQLATPTPHAGVNAVGFIPTPDTVFGALHKISFTILSSADFIRELHGLEVEFEVGPELAG